MHPLYCGAPCKPRTRARAPTGSKTFAAAAGMASASSISTPYLHTPPNPAVSHSYRGSLMRLSAPRECDTCVSFCDGNDTLTRWQHNAPCSRQSHAALHPAGQCFLQEPGFARTSQTHHRNRKSCRSSRCIERIRLRGRSTLPTCKRVTEEGSCYPQNRRASNDFTRKRQPHRRDTKTS
eukprot:3522922-Pleurochrysis_carterae.AAC.1